MALISMEKSYQNPPLNSLSQHSGGCDLGPGRWCPGHRVEQRVKGAAWGGVVPALGYWVGAGCWWPPLLECNAN